MKIVYVVPLLAPYAIPRYQELARMPDTEVHVIIEQDTHKERTGWRFQEVDGVSMHLLHGGVARQFHQTNRKGNYAISNTRIYSFELRKLISRINPDIVLVCNSTQIMMLLGKRQYKLGVIVEDTLRADESRPLFKKILKRHMLKKADFYLPFTKDALKFLKHNKIDGPIIRNSWSMDIDFFSDLTDEERMKKRIEYGMKDSTAYILVSNLIPCKGIEPFLQGWSAMSESFHKRAKLFILGDGDLRADLSKLISQKNLSNVSLLGHKEYQEVSHYLQCGDIFVLPTLQDLCSLSVLEAMASKRPVLTTIYNGAREFVREGVNGFIFDPLDKNSIVDVLNKAESSDLKRMSEASFEIIKEYSTRNVMGNLRKDLENIM